VSENIAGSSVPAPHATPTPILLSPAASATTFTESLSRRSDAVERVFRSPVSDTTTSAARNLATTPHSNVSESLAAPVHLRFLPPAGIARQIGSPAHHALTPASPAAGAKTAPSAAVDLKRLADQVYNLITRRVASERERRGLS
jgi:hypothetical protein